jgi:hypothetical protein
MNEDVKVTPKMKAAGERAIFEKVGVADLGGLFFAHDLVISVWKAMQRALP